MSFLAAPDTQADHPLDVVAAIFASQDWVFDRPKPDELKVSVAGRQGAYHLSFYWQDEVSALQFLCACDLRLNDAPPPDAARALRAINERLWLGHFDLCGTEAVPTFRHTTLLRGMQAGEPVEDLIEIGLAECERHYNVFALLAAETSIDPMALDLALADEAGVA